MNDSGRSIIFENIHKTIFKLSFPGMVSSVLQTLYQIIDAYWVGKLGPEALAAIGGASFVLWAILSLTALSINGITTLVAQNIGAGKEDAAKYVAGQGLLLSTLITIILSVSIFYLQDALFNLMGFSPNVGAMAYSYMTVLLAGLIFMFWFLSLEAVFRGLGDTKTPMLILAVALAFNSIADPVFIFGWFGLPAMHIGGAAIGTVLAHMIAAILAYYFLKRKNFLPVLRSDRGFKIDYYILKRMLNIGTPIALGGFFFSIIYVVLTRIIANFGTEAIAAIGVCHRVEGIAWFACVGFSVAASTLVGQFVGARQINKAGNAAWLVNGYGCLALLFVSFVFYFFPEWLIRIFTMDADVVKIGVEYLRIVAIFETFLALEVIMEGVFSGAGYTLPVMLVSIPITGARIPLAWYFSISLGMGTAGIWWAIAGTTFLKGFLNTVLFAVGLWKKKLDLVPV
jgi:putative MATE family efflux protein